MVSWVLLTFYTSNGVMHTTETRGLAEQSCKTAAAAWSKKYSHDFAICIQEGRQVSLEDLVKNMKVEQ